MAMNQNLVRQLNEDDNQIQTREKDLKRIKVEKERADRIINGLARKS